MRLFMPDTINYSIYLLISHTNSSNSLNIGCIFSVFISLHSSRISDCNQIHRPQRRIIKKKGRIYNIIISLFIHHWRSKGKLIKLWYIRWCKEYTYTYEHKDLGISKMAHFVLRRIAARGAARTFVFAVMPMPL